MEYAKLILWALTIALPVLGVLAARSKIRELSRLLFGTANFIKGLKSLEEDNYNTPISVSGGTTLYLPRIKKDFPDFEFNVISKKVEQFFHIYFEALEKQSILSLQKIENTEAVESKIQFEIDDLITLEERVNIDKIKFNGISIWNYVKSKEVATINFQVSLGYKYIKESPKKRESGVDQVKYSLDMSYLFEDYSKENFALTCQSCGGPIKDTQTFCEFCGAGLVRNIEMVWRISGFSEMNKYNWPDK